MSPTKPWNTKAWKQRREEILAVRNACEWCGLTQEESLEKYGKGLTVDHIQGYVQTAGLHAWVKVAWELYEKQAGAEARKSIREPKGFKEFKKSHKAKIDREYDRRKEDPFDRYLNLRDEDIQVLCSRCHMQKTRGFRLCAKCKERYHASRYDACYECNKEKIEQRRRERERKDKEEEEADADFEKHYREFNYGIDHPELHHLKFWYCEECTEPIDFQHFCNYQLCDACFIRYEALQGRLGKGLNAS